MGKIKTTDWHGESKMNIGLVIFVLTIFKEWLLYSVCILGYSDYDIFLKENGRGSWVNGVKNKSKALLKITF